jgi:hypothetical protein
VQHAPFQSQPSLTPSQIADLRLAASKLSGPDRRSFEAEMTLKYCQGNPLKAEAVFGWGPQTVALGLAEKRSGIICLGAQSAFSGRKRWEESISMLPKRFVNLRMPIRNRTRPFARA